MLLFHEQCFIRYAFESEGEDWVEGVRVKALNSEVGNGGGNTVGMFEEYESVVASVSYLYSVLKSVDSQDAAAGLRRCRRGS